MNDDLENYINQVIGQCGEASKLLNTLTAPTMDGKEQARGERTGVELSST